jgi:hypothetical protein
MNGSIPASWKVINYNGNKVISIQLSGASCVMEIVPKDFLLNDASNYELEMDMWFPLNVYKDRHIAYKYLSGNQWYGIKFIQPYQQEFYKVNLAEYPHLGVSNFITGIQPNIKYRMKVRVVENQISFYINDSLVHQVDDKEPVLNNGTIALQASLSHLGPHTTYFDNIKVTDLSPKPLFPHFSQIDEQWANDIYDHATNWTSFPTIKNWGCALTSATMILNHHGYTKGPEGQTTTPQALNQYLTSIPDGYTPNGKIIWSAVTKYAQESKRNNQSDSEIKLLEFTYPEFDQNLAISDIENNHPPIVKINMEPDRRGYHFVVASALTNENQLIINDPIQTAGEQKTIQEVYPNNELVSLGRFIPSSTDLSYLWFETASNVHVSLSKGDIDYTNSLYHETGSIYDQSTDQLSPPSHLVGFAKPEAGQYLITLSTTTDQLSPVFSSIFNQNATSSSKTETVFISSQVERKITIEYNQEFIEQSTITIQSNHELLNQLISYLQTQNDISPKLAGHYQHLIKQSQKLVNHKGRGSIAVLEALYQQTTNAFVDQRITFTTQEVIKQEIDRLLFTLKLE